MKIKYENPFTGLWPKCPHGLSQKVGSLSCQRCSHNHGDTGLVPIRKETLYNGKEATVYGGTVDCRHGEGVNQNENTE